MIEPGHRGAKHAGACNPGGERVRCSLAPLMRLQDGIPRLPAVPSAPLKTVEREMLGWDRLDALLNTFAKAPSDDPPTTSLETVQGPGQTHAVWSRCCGQFADRNGNWIAINGGDDNPLSAKGVSRGGILIALSPVSRRRLSQRRLRVPLRLCLPPISSE